MQDTPKGFTKTVRGSEGFHTPGLIKSNRNTILQFSKINKSKPGQVSSCSTQSMLLKDYVYISYKIKHKNNDGDKKEIVVLLGARPGEEPREETNLHFVIPSYYMYSSNIDFIKHDLREILSIDIIDLFIPKYNHDDMSHNLIDSLMVDLANILSDLNDLVDQVGSVHQDANGVGILDNLLAHFLKQLETVQQEQ